MDGSRIVRANGCALHSSYHPWREAQRALPHRHAGCYLVLGECLGYLSQLLKRRDPGSRVLVLFCDDRLASEADLPPTVEVWSPGCADGVVDFLRKSLSATDFPGLEVVGWEASRRAYRREYAELEREVLLVLRRLQSEFATVASFGRLWLRNTLENYTELSESCALPCPDFWRGQPVLIAAAGPSLNDCLSWICRYRSKFRLLACTSSLATLNAAGIRADCAISSDPGWLARRHYAYLPSGLPLLLPLSAQPPRYYSQGPVLPFLQGNVWERVLPEFVVNALPKITENGTVVGSALLLARLWQASEVMVAGLDLAYFDVQDHSVPHAFSPLSLGGDRFNPLEQRRWRPLVAASDCGGGWRQTSSLREYQLWFEEFASRTRMKLFQPGSRRLAGWRDASELLPRLRPLKPFRASGEVLCLRSRADRGSELRAKLSLMARRLDVSSHEEKSQTDEALLALAPLRYRDFLREGRAEAQRKALLEVAREQLRVARRWLN